MLRRSSASFAAPLLFAVTVLVGTFATGSARAGEPREHDGLYLRLGGGFGYFADAATSDDEPVVGKTEGTAQGFALVSEVALGATLFRGFILGGGIYSSLAPTPKATNIKQSTAAGTFDDEENAEFDASALHVIAPFVDYYFNPRRGFHIQGGVGLAVLSTGDGHTETSNAKFFYGQTAVGFGAMFGIGNEWWVGKNRGIGVLGRLTMGFVGGDDDNDPSTQWSHTTITPAVLFTATMN